MKKLVIIIFLASIALLIPFYAFAAQMNSTSYKQNVIVSEGGANVSSSSYKSNLAVGIINWVINSTSYINKLGFFHTWLLADGQPCATASQCEGGFCCSSLCQSSACPSPSPSPSGGGGGEAAAGAGGGGAVNASAFLPKKQETIKDFSLSTSSIKEHLALGAAKTQSFKIINTGNTALKLNLNVVTVNAFVFFSESSISLQPGEEKTVEANIVGKMLGSYLGEIQVTGSDITKSIDVVIEVVSEEVLFDAKMDIPPAYKEVGPGDNLKMQITLLNVGPARKVDVTTTYLIKDKYGNTLEESSETFAVEKQTSYVKTLKIPADAKHGDYLAIVELRYGKSFAVSSEIFKVAEKKSLIKEAITPAKSLAYIFIIFIGLLFLFVYLLVPKERILQTLRYRRKRK